MPPNLPKWIVTAKTLSCIKEIQKGNLVSNFTPTTCLALIWKLLTYILAEELYVHIKANSKKQIHCHGNKRDIGREAEVQKKNY